MGEHAIDEMEALSRTAARLRPWPVRGKALPNLLFFTDPDRTPDPEGVAERLPNGAAVVFRAFGAPDAAARGSRLREITRRRGLTLLVGADAELALAIGADGVHLPERLAGQASALRAAHPDWLITMAAHGEAAARAGVSIGVDALVVSPIFPQPQPICGRAAGRGGSGSGSSKRSIPRSTRWAACARTRSRACWTRGLSGSRRWRR